MIPVSVCIGTTCHRNNWRTFYRIQSAVKQRHLQDRIRLKAEFCLGHCGEGPNVQIEDQIFGGITPERVEELLDREILPRLRLRTREYTSTH